MNVQKLIERAIADRGFRQQLKKDPAAAAKSSGVSIPAGASLVVLEDDANTMNLVITPDTSGDSELMPEALQVLNRARKDEKFKNKLLTNAWSAVKEEIGVAVPESIKLVVVENTTNKIHLVLPVSEDAESELSDMELEQVAGGRARRRPAPRSSGGGGQGGAPRTSGISAMSICL